MDFDKIFRTTEAASIGVLIKRCSGNMQQIYRTTMPKCDFHKFAKQCKFKSHFDMGVLL